MQDLSRHGERHQLAIRKFRSVIKDRYVCKSCTTTVPAYIKDNGKFKTDFISLLYDRLAHSTRKPSACRKLADTTSGVTLDMASHTSPMRTGLRHSIIPIPFRPTVPAGLHRSHNQHHREKRQRCADDPRWRRGGIAVAESLTAS